MIQTENKSQIAQPTDSSKRCPSCGFDRPQRWLEGPDRFHGGRDLYLLLRCSSCSLVWLDNPPTPEMMGQHYTAEYDRLITRAGEGSPQRWRSRREMLTRYKQSGTLLDLGCSSGSFLATMRGDAWRLHGIEMSEIPARRAEARTQAKVFIGDILDARFPAETFDAITCFDVFEHVYCPRQVLERVWEWLKPGGVFYTLMPNIDSGQARVFRSYWYGLELPRHLSHFSPESLRYLARDTGFEELTIVTSPGRPLIEYSSRYVSDRLLQGIGISRTPVAKASPPGIPWRVARRIYRLTALPVISGLISMAGGGEVMEAVFSKKAS